MTPFPLMANVMKKSNFMGHFPRTIQGDVGFHCRWNGQNFASNSSTWIGIRDRFGRKLPNGEHPAIHWNRWNFSFKISAPSFLYFQVFKAVDDGVERLRWADIHLVLANTCRSSFCACKGPRWKKHGPREKLVKIKIHKKSVFYCSSSFSVKKNTLQFSWNVALVDCNLFSILLLKIGRNS